VEDIIATKNGTDIESIASTKCIEDIKSDANYFNPSSVHLMSEAFELQDPYLTSSKLVQALDKPWKFCDVLEARARSKAEDKLRRAVVFSREENYKDAISSCCDSIDLYATADAFVTRGAAYANIGVLNLAIKDFKEALLLDPNHANATSYLAATLQKISALHAPASALTGITDIQEGNGSSADPRLKHSGIPIQNESRPLSTIDRLQRDLDISRGKRADGGESSLRRVARRRSRSASSRSRSSSKSSSTSSSSSSSSSQSSVSSAAYHGESQSRSKRREGLSAEEVDGKGRMKYLDETRRSKRNRGDNTEAKKKKKRKKDSKKESKRRKHKKNKRRRRRSSSDVSLIAASAAASTAWGPSNRLANSIMSGPPLDEDNAAGVHPILQRKVHKLWG
jgi:tetratricopeptide (TPR) repeat protein